MSAWKWGTTVTVDRPPLVVVPGEAAGTTLIGLAKIRSEGGLLLRGEILLAEEEHLVLQTGTFQRVQNLGSEWLFGVHALDYRSKAWRDRRELHRSRRIDGCRHTNSPNSLWWLQALTLASEPFNFAKCSDLDRDGYLTGAVPVTVRRDAARLSR